MADGLVFNIQRFSIHDGPGIRTTVFLKGCGLRCFWCHNPESLSTLPQVQFFPQKCIGCGKCVEVCPKKAHAIDANGRREFRRELCRHCGRCVDVCYAEALVMTGKHMTVSEVMDEVMKDKLFYDNSGGGVTYSGGEPLLQREFIKELLVESKKNGLNTAVDTAGNVPWEAFEQVLPYVDLFLYDIKVMDPDKHRYATGVNNRQLLVNLQHLASCKANIWIRIPVIPGVNDNVPEMRAIADFVECLSGVEVVELLPFHRLGEGKYESLGMEYKARGYNSPSDEKMQELAEVFEQKNLPVKRG
ncbi:glycyl-radical enzyme activating protein [Mahella australiensis]|uniref:Glycyl-radical enzyme activating protein family n=1 Tax=Mahella australiensis (strain DSM 15567 / CIP 107919 / 50-1 BON) TaxID=697281 RepID=F3ZX75_MAHA5|nr:glycyl-radical enzyme activating protein [Mahella australiensis]AEE96532.1 glycyl-radical enzyme activating protein family [Mahella australiensis 50-1 BON]